MTLAQSRTGTRRFAMGGSDANVISAVEQGMKFFQIVDNCVIAGPNTVRLFRRPSRVALGCHAVIGMIESRAALPIRPEDLRATALGFAFRALREFEHRPVHRVPEGSCWRGSPVA